MWPLDFVCKGTDVLTTHGHQVSKVDSGKNLNGSRFFLVEWVLVWKWGWGVFPYFRVESTELNPGKISCQDEVSRDTLVDFKDNV